MYWLKERKDGQLTGNMTGYETRDAAGAHRDDLAQAIISDPSWNGGQWAGYSWTVEPCTGGHDHG